MNTLKKKKQELRKILKQKQQLLSNEVIHKKSLEITKEIQLMPQYQQAFNIAIFMSLEKEFNTNYLLQDSSKQFFIPKIEGDEMSFYLYTNEFEVSNFGIREPISKIKICRDEIDLMIIPYLGFTEKGYRLGYGKGYYDRYLENSVFPVVLPGIEEYLIQFEPEEFDKPIKYIIKK